MADTSWIPQVGDQVAAPWDGGRANARVVHPARDHRGQLRCGIQFLPHPAVRAGRHPYDVAVADLTPPLTPDRADDGRCVAGVHGNPERRCVRPAADGQPYCAHHVHTPRRPAGDWVGATYTGMR